MFYLFQRYSSGTNKSVRIGNNNVDVDYTNPELSSKKGAKCRFHDLWASQYLHEREIQTRGPRRNQQQEPQVNHLQAQLGESSTNAQQPAFQAHPTAAPVSNEVHSIHMEIAGNDDFINWVQCDTCDIIRVSGVHDIHVRNGEI